MVVQFIQKRGEARRYRRGVPRELRPRVGKWEITIPLGASRVEALRRYPAVHDHVEWLLKQAASPQFQPLVPTPLDRHSAAHRHVEELGFSPTWSGWGEPDDQEGGAREIVAEQIAERYPLDYEGNPVGITPQDAAALTALMLGTRDRRPNAEF